MRWLHIYTLLMALKAVNSEIQAAPPDQIKVVLESEARVGELFTEVWVLRDLLALQQGGDIAAQAVTFQGLQDQLNQDKQSMLDQLAKDPSATDLEESYMKTASTIAERLDTLGVRRDSDLAKRLVEGYVIFSQMLLLDGQPSLCELHPFRLICQ
jgi:hypothetical protein